MKKNKVSPFIVTGFVIAVGLLCEDGCGGHEPGDPCSGKEAFG